MSNNLSSEALAIIRRMQQNELTESVIYEKIAKFAKGEENRQTLKRLSAPGLWRWLPSASALPWCPSL